jgi:hypothetical protein
VEPDHTQRQVTASVRPIPFLAEVVSFLIHCNCRQAVEFVIAIVIVAAWMCCCSCKSAIYFLFFSPRKNVEHSFNYYYYYFPFSSSPKYNMGFFLEARRERTRADEAPFLGGIIK